MALLKAVSLNPRFSELLLAAFLAKMNCFYTASNPNIARRVKAMKANAATKTETVAIAVVGRLNRGSKGLIAVKKIPRVKLIK
jgi:hypothetical protein